MYVFEFSVWASFSACAISSECLRASSVSVGFGFSAGKPAFSRSLLVRSMTWRSSLVCENTRGTGTAVFPCVSIATTDKAVRPAASTAIVILENIKMRPRLGSEVRKLHSGQNSRMQKLQSFFAQRIQNDNGARYQERI